MKINLISSHVKISSSANKSLNEPKYYFFMIEISWKIARKYSATLGNLLIYSAIFGKCSNCSNERRKAFGEFLKIFGNLRKMFGNLREVAKMSLILFFFIYNEQNITYSLVDTIFILPCSTLEEKIRIHTGACNFFYILSISIDD